MNKSEKYNQFSSLVGAHFRELIREPGVLFWGIIFPILMSLGLGIAFTQKKDVTHHIAVLNKPATESDHDKSNLRTDSLNLIIPGFPSGSEQDIQIPDDKLGNTTFSFLSTDWKTAMIMLKRGEVNLILEKNETGIIYHFDPMNSDAQLVFMKLADYFSKIKMAQKPGRAEIIRPMELKGTRYIDFLVPGLIAMGAMMSCMWGLSYGIIDRRAKKLLRRMVATPMKKSYFLMSFITVRIVMNFTEAILLMVFTWLVFGITVQGSIPALIALFLAGNIAFAGVAVLVSSHTANTEIGNGLINFVVMPMMVLSGIFFSYHSFPDWSLPVIRNLPLTMLTDGIRAIFNEGAGFSEIMLPFLVLVAIGFVFFVTGLKIFKWH
jgi:ABC-2 type transport system permease protein